MQHTYDFPYAGDVTIKEKGDGYIVIESQDCGNAQQIVEDILASIYNGSIICPDFSTPDNGDTPDTSIPDNGDTPDTSIPDNGDAPDTSTPDTGNTPDSSSPDIGDAPDSSIPDNGDTPDSSSPDTGNTPDTSTPDNGDAPDTSTPDTGNTPDTSIPDNGDAPDTSTPDTGNTPDTSIPDNGDTPDTSTPDVDDSTESVHPYVTQVLQLVNRERLKEGLPALTLDADVTAAANVRAKEIKQSFSHTRPNGSSFSTALKEQGVSFNGSGENIAWGQTSPEQVMNGWMNSAGHRANILNQKFKNIGIGFYQDEAGRNYWVQLFTY